MNEKRRLAAALPVQIHHPPVHNPDARPSPRDPRRRWARVLPRQRGFTNPYSRLLAEWADALRFAGTWASFRHDHPDFDLHPAERDR